MGVAVVTVAGRSYRVGCEDGEEARLEELGAALDRKVAAMRKNFGEIGDQRLIVMAALETADEADESKGRVEALEGEIKALRERIATLESRQAALTTRLARDFEAAARRLERLAEDLAKDDDALAPL